MIIPLIQDIIRPMALEGFVGRYYDVPEFKISWVQDTILARRGDYNARSRVFRKLTGLYFSASKTGLSLAPKRNAEREAFRAFGGLKAFNPPMWSQADFWDASWSVVDAVASRRIDADDLIAPDKPFDPVGGAIVGVVDDLVVSKRKREAILMSLHQLERAEIIRQTGYSEVMLAKTLKEFRPKIEEKVLIPRGMLKLGYYVDYSRLAHAASRGQLSTYELFNRRYVTEEAVGNFLSRQKEVDGIMMVRLNKAEDPTFYAYLRQHKYFSTLISKSDGGLFISPHVLEVAREVWEANHEGEDNYDVRIADLQGGIEYSRYLHAAQRGTLDVKRVGRFWFTTENAFEEYAAKH